MENIYDQEYKLYVNMYEKYIYIYCIHVDVEIT